MEKLNFNKKINMFRFAVFASFLSMVTLLNAQSLENQDRVKIKTLQELIKKCEKNKLDVLKEKMTVRTAEVFLKYANWDEANIPINTSSFQQVPIYKKNASKLATDLPDFERSEINLMLDEAIQNINLILSGAIIRKPTPDIDWSKVSLVKDQLIYNNRPVFLSDYTWKPKVTELTQYFGDLDGFFLTPSLVVNDNGEINKKAINELKAKPDGSIGFIFMNHKNVPQWAKDKYTDFEVGKRLYTEYDIDNPGAREMQSMLLKGTVPYIAGKKYSQLGYMLCNEPHWNTVANTWATGLVSNFTIDKFKKWLEEKHGTIADLNKRWGTNFSDFSQVKLQIPIAESLHGTPQWYDWMSFNMYRVTDWFTFLKTEVRKYDPKAKVHIKVIPKMWSENKVDHGLDFEALTNLSDIIGNDASSGNSFFRANDNKWSDKYAMDWRELSTSYDFLKSVSPDKIIFNTEAHFLSTTRSRDLYLKPEYARAAYWLATMEGLNASQTWYWSRREDGSFKKEDDKGYAGSNNQQPRIINEVASTMMDLNSYSEDIEAIQELKKPLRIFYSKTSAIIKITHMDDIFPIYESLYFNGLPIGYATKGIIDKQDNKGWEAILVYKTEFVTKDELNALQSYLNNGGTILIDSVSLKKNEYGQELPKLNQGNGHLIMTNSLNDMSSKAMKIVDEKGLLPEVTVTETNSVGDKGCVWRCVKNKTGNNVLSIVNLGKSDAKLNINLKGATRGVDCKDLLKEISVSSTPTLKPYEVYFVEVTKKK